jgi:hypothetical protein
MPAAAGSFALRAGCIFELEQSDVEDADSGDNTTFGEITDFPVGVGSRPCRRLSPKCPGMGQHVIIRRYFEYQESSERNP